MKCSIQREALMAALQNVIGVVERRQTMQILANVLLILHEDRLELVGSDTEMEVVSFAPLHGVAEQVGTITTPARTFFDVCRNLPEKCVIQLGLDGGRLKIIAAQSDFNLMTLPANQYPRMETEQETLTFSLAKSEVQSLIQRTHFAIAEQSPHYYLKGMLFEVKDGVVRAAASDAHRLAMCSVALPSLQHIDAHVIVPRKGVNELLRVMSDGKESVQIAITPNFIRFSWENFTLTSKLVASKYPNPNKFVPEDGNKRLILNRLLLRDALLRVGVLSSEILHGVKLQLRPNLLMLLANNPEAEKAEDQIAIEYTGSNLDIAFNINYLVEALNSLTSEQIALVAKESEDGIIIEEIDGAIDTINVIMPLEI